MPYIAQHHVGKHKPGDVITEDTPESQIKWWLSTGAIAERDFVPAADKHEVTEKQREAGKGHEVHVIWTPEEQEALRKPLTPEPPLHRPTIPVGEIGTEFVVPNGLAPAGGVLSTSTAGAPTTQSADEELMELDLESVQKLPYVQMKRYAELIGASIVPGGREPLIGSILDQLGKLSEKPNE